MTKKLIWRLSAKPTVEDLKIAIEAGIISKDEAKQMLVKEEDEINIDQDQLKDLKDELKLLRELVLSNINQKETRIIEKHFHDYYPKYTWTNVPGGGNWATCYLNASSSLGSSTSKMPENGTFTITTESRNLKVN
jgi:hypothetical protein